MTNLQKIQQETEEIFLKMFDYTTKHDLDTYWAVLLDKEDKNPAGKEQLLDLLHSRESIAYKAGYDEGYADCSNDVKKLSEGQTYSCTHTIDGSICGKCLGVKGFVEQRHSEKPDGMKPALIETLKKKLVD